MSDDVTLLRRYADESAEEAFAELVRRHLNLVYSVALRRTGGDSHLAADVAQGVFTALARRARSISPGVVLTGWLYTTTRNIAIDTVRAAQRRQAREHIAHTLQSVNSEPDRAWEELRPLLEDVMDELPARDREAVLLRFYQGRPFSEIGAQIGITEDGARMRVDRALEKLNAQLARRGITSTTVALSAVLANGAAVAAPAGLAASLTSTALADAAVVGSGIWLSTAAFMCGTKGLIALAVALVLALAAAFHEWREQQSARAAETVANKHRIAQQAQLTELTDRIQAAERRRVTLAANLRQRQVALSAAADASTAARAAEMATAATQAAEKAAFNAAALPLLRNDPTLKYLRLARHRWTVHEDYGDLFKEFHFTRDQNEKFIRLFADWAESRPEHGKQWSIDPFINDIIYSEEFVAKIRAQFGAEVAERYEQLHANRLPRLAVRMLSSRLYYLDEPFTPQQEQGLTQIFSGAVPGKFPGVHDGLHGLDSVDWGQVLVKSESLLSSKQWEGLRSLAALARQDGLMKSVGGK